MTAEELGRIYRLGCLLPLPRAAPAMVAFIDELRVQGFAEGQNLTIVPGGFEFRSDQIEELVAGLVKVAPDAIMSGGDPATRALQKATRTIPIVVITEDMVAAGFAVS
jgi:putative ABC transport system substrate-binding protein